MTATKPDDLSDLRDFFARDDSQRANPTYGAVAATMQDEFADLREFFLRDDSQPRMAGPQPEPEQPPVANPRVYITRSFGREMTKQQMDREVAGRKKLTQQQDEQARALEGIRKAAMSDALPFPKIFRTNTERDPTPQETALFLRLAPTYRAVRPFVKGGELNREMLAEIALTTPPDDRPLVLMAVADLAEREGPRSPVTIDPLIAGIVDTVEFARQTIQPAAMVSEAGLDRDQQAFARELKETREGKRSSQDILSQVQRQIGPLAVGMTGGGGAALGARGVGLARAGLAARTAGATATWTATMYPQEYDRLKKAGVNDLTATVAGAASAFVQAAVENLNFNAFGLPPDAAKRVRQNIARELLAIVKPYGKELTEEGAQSIISDLSLIAGQTLNDMQPDVGGGPNVAQAVVANAAQQMEDAALPLLFLMAPGTVAQRMLAENPERAARLVAKKELSRADLPEVPTARDRARFHKEIRAAAGKAEVFRDRRDGRSDKPPTPPPGGPAVTEAAPEALQPQPVAPGATQPPPAGPTPSEIQGEPRVAVSAPPVPQQPLPQPPAAESGAQVPSEALRPQGNLGAIATGGGPAQQPPPVAPAVNPPVTNFKKDDPNEPIADVQRGDGEQVEEGRPEEGQADVEEMPAGEQAEAVAGGDPDRALVDRLGRALGIASQAKRPLTAAELFAEADTAYGGTRAEGKYGPSDAYDALETAINRAVRDNLNLKLGEAVRSDNPEVAKKAVTDIAYNLDLIPTQTNRSGEKDALQQFSTPPHYSFAVNWVANITPDDVVLEPSAGTGSLAVHALNADATVYANELSPRRANLLKLAGVNKVFTEDAEQIANILPGKMPAPTVVVMNPPFSRAGQRMGDKKLLDTGANHIEQALKLLAPGGRLVAIVGRGMADGSKAFAGWWKAIREQYAVRANVSVSGGVYKKYGTTFGTQVLVIDKVAPDDATIVRGEASSVVELIDRLAEVRRARSQPQRIQSGVPGAPEGGKAADQRRESVQPATGAVDAGAEAGRAAGPGEPVRVGTEPAVRRVGGNEAGERPAPAVAAGRGRERDRGIRAADQAAEPGRSGEPDRGESVRQPATEAAEPASAVAVESTTPEAEKRESLGESIFEPYKPARVRIPGAKPHPASLVESAAMAAVTPPAVTYRPKLAAEVVTGGKLSDVQLERVVYAGEAHSKRLEDGARRGFLVGDGTGVGKGRIISGIIADNFAQGRRKAVWLSLNDKLLEDAKRDWSGIGADAKQVFPLAKIKPDAPIAANDGILFVTYGTLKSGSKKGKSRLDQIVDWLGEDFDGVIAFDEAHKMGNAIADKGKRGRKQASQTALTGVALQKKLPDARIVYVSATAATEVSNLAYAERLGLWGPGTAFTSKVEFINQIASGGVAAMELVARDLKALGSYQAANISFNDGTPEGTVNYERVEHALNDDQREMYDTLAEAWQLVLNNIGSALAVTDGDARAKSDALSQFWGAHQRFFNQIMTAMQTPSIVNRIEADLKAGRSAVVQLTNTYEAAQERAISKLGEDDDVEDFDITPRDALIQYVERSFPTTQYEEYRDDDGNTRLRPVVDSAGNPVRNAEAVRMRDDLLDRLGSLRVPESPIDMLINHFGDDVVAEVTGRSRRVVLKKQDDGTRKKQIESLAPSFRKAEVSRFQNGKKRVLIFSEAGGTGASYHAARDAENQQPRRHYLLQAGWRADNAIQGLGRTHRSNQKQAPTYVLVHTDLKGQKRFISTIARRLAQLGALTKGQRQAGSTGVFSAADNLESTEAKDALTNFFRDLVAGRIEAIGVAEFERQTGLKLLDQNGNLRADLPPITQFLNRILSLRTDMQNKVFDAFDERLQTMIERATQAGTLDTGVENYRADRIAKVSEQVVYTHSETGAVTKYVKLRTGKRIKPIPWKDVARDDAAFYQSKRGKVYAVFKTSLSHTNANTGEVTPQARVVDQSSRELEDAVKFAAADQYTKLTAAEAEKLWDAAVEKLPEFKEKDEHLLTGILLPIWDRVRGGEKPQVFRVLTDDGEQLLGRVLPPNSVASTLKALGATPETPKLSAAEAIEKILDGEVTIELSNGWRIKRSRVQSENRIEIVGPDHRHFEELRDAGAFTERIQFATRVFIPTGDEAARVFEKVTKGKPIADVEYMRTSSFGPGATTPSQSTGRRSKATGLSEHAIVAWLDKTFDVPIRAGRVRTPRAAGIYKHFAQVIRLRGKFWGNLAVAAHEVAHHLDERNKSLIKDPKLSKAERLELEYLDYDPSKKRVDEGFAEFFRHYITEDNAAALAPEFSKRFDAWLAANPEMEQKVAEFRRLVDRWRYQGAYERASANLRKDRKPFRPADEPLAAWLGDKARGLWNDFYHHWIDRWTHTAKLDQLRKQQGRNDDPGDTLYALVSAFSGTAQNHAWHAITKGVHGVSAGNFLRKIGDSLQDALKGINLSELHDFRLFAWARHARETISRGVNPGMSKADADHLVSTLGNPRFEAAADKLTAYNNSLIDMLEQAGVLPEDDANRIRQSWKTYIPLLRVKPDAPLATQMFGGEQIVGGRKVVFGRKGGGHAVLDPLLATIERTQTFYGRALQQQAVLKLVQEVNSTNGAGRYAERVPPNMKSTSLKVEEIIDQLDAAGIIDVGDVAQQDVDAVLTIWRPDYRTYQGRPVQMVMVDGKPQLYHFDPDMLKAVAAISDDALPWLLDSTLGKATALFKAGATGLNPAFAVANIVRDALTYAMQTTQPLYDPRTWFKPAELVARYIAHTSGAKVDPIIDLWIEMGGSGTTSAGEFGKAAKNAPERLTAKTLGEKARTSVSGRGALEFLREVINVSEVGPRLAEFEAVLRRRGWTRDRIRTAGLPPRAALVEAFNASKDVTINFRRAGATGRKLNRWTVNYFNAAVQSIDKFARTWKAAPGRTAIRAALMAAATLAYVLRKRDEDWYKDAEPWLKYGFWVFSDGDGAPMIRIPRSYEWGWLLVGGVEAAINGVLDADPAVVGEWAKLAAKRTIPGLSPPIVAPALEAYFNYDWFRDRPIVDERLDHVEPADQSNAWTTGTAKRVGGFLGISPARLEHLLDGITGGGFTMVTRPAEKVAGGDAPWSGETDFPLSKPFTLKKDYSQAVTDFYDEREALDKAVGSAKARGEDRGAAGERLRALDAAADLMSKMRKLIPQGADREQRFAIERYIIGTAREALGREPLERYPSPLAADDLPPEVAAIRDQHLGRLLYVASKPIPKRKEREPIGAYKDRIADDVAAIERAKKAVEQLDLDPKSVESLMRAEARRQGDRIEKVIDGKPSAFSERLRRVRKKAG